MGIAQGMRTTARSNPRPRKTSFITSAIPRPMPISSGMVVTTKNRVVRKDCTATGSVPEIGIVFPAHHLLAEPREGQDRSDKNLAGRIRTG